MEDMKENKTGAVGTGRVSDAMKRQKERFRDKMRKCVAPGTKKAQAGSASKGTGGTEARKKRNLSGYSGQTEKISKGKSYKSKMDCELKEKDPKNREVQNRKYVTDMKPGGRNRRTAFFMRRNLRLGSSGSGPRPDRPFGWNSDDERPHY